jgi:hypothetical protein
MNFPVPPLHAAVIDANGMCTTEWAQYYSNLHLQQKINLPDDGFWIPKVTADQRAEIEKEYLDDKNTIPNPKYNQGQHVVDVASGEHYLNIAGTFKKVTVT